MAPRCAAARTPRPLLRFWAGVALITFAGAALRAAFLNHPMRYDESMVFFEYVLRPLPEVLTRYDRVQNHVLHTLLEHEAVRLLGPSPPVLRLPAVLAGTALIPLAMILARSVTPHGTYAGLAGGLVAGSNVLVDYSTNARGYTMVCAFTLGMCLCTVALLRRPMRWSLGLTWAALGALGTFTIPTMLFTVVGLTALFSLAHGPGTILPDGSGTVAPPAIMNRHARPRRIRLVRVGAVLGLWALLTFLLYLPALVRTGLSQVLSTREAVHQYAEAHFQSAGQVVRLTWEDWTRDWPLPVLLVGGVGLALAAWRAVRRGSPVWAMPGVMLLGGAAVAGLMPMRPYPRVWLYLLPVVLTFAACGLAWLRPVWLRRATVGLLTLGTVLGGYRVSQCEFLVAEDPHTLVDAERVAQECAAWPARRFALILSPSTEAVHYYADLHDLPRPTHPFDPRVRTTYVVVNTTQTLEEVLAAPAGGPWIDEYGPPRLYKALPHCRIYQMDRRE